MKKCILLTVLWAVATLQAMAQRHEILSPRIASLQVVAGEEWMQLPVVELGGPRAINIAFDDLTHDYHRYAYRLEHCEADWTVSEEIFESDYCEGFARDNTIENYAQSINTNQLYTHYRLQLPNDRCRMRMSGNYKVTVYDANDDDRPVLIACFMVVEPLMSVGLEVTTNTDADLNGRHQQVGMKLDYGNMRVTDYQSQIKTVVLQNGKWQTSIVNARPQYVSHRGLVWSHCRDLIFDGGNEYRKFEMLDVSHTTMGLERMVWDGHTYHAWIWTDEPRPSYVYDEDADGSFYLRNSDNRDNDILSEYAMVHFRLASPRLPGEVYLGGNWTMGHQLPQYRMEWNEATQLYEAVVWLKQGYYNYEYLWLRSDGTLAPVPSEGNFYQTQNTYQALVYFKGMGERTDRLVGMASLTTSGK